MLQVCLNGPRTKAELAALPVSPAELAAQARAAVAVAAGARDVHLHPKSADGKDSLAPAVVAAAVTAVRAAVPGVRVGGTTGAWAEPDPARRVRLIERWTVRPDHASVNWHEDGAEDVARALLAGELGLATRIGLEDTLTLPDGTPATGNADLVRAAARHVGRFGPIWTKGPAPGGGRRPRHRGSGRP